MIKRPSASAPDELSENEDYYYEGRAMVFTARFHLRRGYCCGSGCRHCPYKSRQEEGVKEKDSTQRD